MNSRCVALTAAALFAVPALAGSLDPPGPPASTMKPLTALEPRVAVDTLPLRDPGVRVIEQPGSYFLTGNLAGGDGITAISIEAPDVVLDLNGFALLGTEGSDSGISVMPPARNVVVRNGTIRGWPVNAIFAANCQACEFSDLLIADCGSRVSSSALWLGQYGVVRRVTVRGNVNGVGIRTEFNGRIESSIAANNAVGFYLGGDSGSIVDSIAVDNGEGIHLEAASVAIGCVANYNGHGVEMVEGGRVASCDLVGNGEGIYVWGLGAQIENNLFSGNAGTSIWLAASAAQVRVAGNHVACGDGGTGVWSGGAGNLVVGNSFEECATPIDTGTTNAVGELLDLRGGGTIGSPNPYANILF